MKMKWLLIGSILQIISLSKGIVIIDETTHECIKRQSSLYCNFSHSNIQEVYMIPVPSSSDKIYVQNVKKLHLFQLLSTSVYLNNITEIVTEIGVDIPYLADFELVVVNSSLNKIPENVKNVSLEFSNITLLATYRSLEALSVKNSNIEVLRIFGHFENNSFIELHGSRVGKVEKLILDDGSRLTVNDSRLQNVLDNSILIHPKVTPTLENLSGEYKYTSLATDHTFFEKDTSTSLEQCYSEDGYVYCDFKGSDVNEVFLAALDTTVKKLFIYNIKTLYLGESFCTDVEFNNIEEVMIIEFKKNEQCNGFEMIAKDSVFSRIPKNANKITLKNCDVYQLATHRSLEELRLKLSVIGVLNITESFGENSLVEIEWSILRKVERLILDDGSNFTVKYSKFLNVTETSILMHPNVKPTLEDPFGTFRSTDLLTYREKQKHLDVNNNVSKECKEKDEMKSTEKKEMKCSKEEKKKRSLDKMKRSAAEKKKQTQDENKEQRQEEEKKQTQDENKELK